MNDLLNPEAEAEIARLASELAAWQVGGYVLKGQHAERALRAAMLWAYQDAAKQCVEMLKEGSK